MNPTIWKQLASSVRGIRQTDKARKLAHRRAAVAQSMEGAAAARAFYAEPMPCKSLQNRQKELTKSICETSKRVKKLAKKIERAPLEKKAALSADLAVATNELSQKHDMLSQLLQDMWAAGYVEESSSSSSSEDDCSKPRLDARDTRAVGSPAPLAELRQGSVEVCTGKACARRGGSEQLSEALKDRFYGTSVDVTDCKCMGMCKAAANIRVNDAETGASVLLSNINAQVLQQQLPGVKVPDVLV